MKRLAITIASLNLTPRNQSIFMVARKEKIK